MGSDKPRGAGAGRRHESTMSLARNEHPMAGLGCVSLRGLA